MLLTAPEHSDASSAEWFAGCDVPTAAVADGCFGIWACTGTLIGASRRPKEWGPAGR